jgi:hypothetical protein
MSANSLGKMDFRNEPDPGTEERRANWLIIKLAPEIRRRGLAGQAYCKITLPRWLNGEITGFRLLSLPGLEELSRSGIWLISCEYEYELEPSFKRLVAVNEIEIDAEILPNGG